jgi:putative Holliday junction resolvase
MARWLGIDHGTRRLGIAVGDAASGIGSPVAQLTAGEEGTADRIRGLVEEYGAAGVVVGWPLNADGTEGPQGRLARAFAVDLAGATGLDVRLWDERLSSFEADDRLKGSMTRGKKRRRQDAVAAAAILEDFLVGDGPNTAPRADQTC